MREKTFLLAAALVVLADQLSKLAVASFINSREMKLGFFSLVNVRNTGALFGIFRENALLLAWLGLMAAGLVIYMCRDSIKETGLFCALIVGGLIGNAIDRFAFSAVTDFIKVGSFPAFNIADMAATLGVALMITLLLKKKITSSSFFS